MNAKGDPVFPGVEIPVLHPKDLVTELQGTGPHPAGSATGMRWVVSISWQMSNAGDAIGTHAVLNAARTRRNVYTV